MDPDENSPRIRQRTDQPQFSRLSLRAQSKEFLIKNTRSLYYKLCVSAVK